MANKTAQITSSPTSVRLESTWKCYGSPDSNGYYQNQTTPTIATSTVTFDISSIPKSAKISTAYIHAEWSSPAYGFNTRQINGTSVTTNGNLNVTISASELSNGSVSATFKFQSGTRALQNIDTHSGATTVSNIYLYIEYTASSTIYLGGSGSLVGYKLYHAENGALVQYSLYHGENGSLVKY